MGKPSKRYVAIAYPNKGWRIWNRKMKIAWGGFYHQYPEELLNELNGLKRPDKIAELSRQSMPNS